MIVHRPSPHGVKPEVAAQNGQLPGAGTSIRGNTPAGENIVTKSLTSSVPSFTA